MGLDPDPETMRRLGHLAVDRAVAHLANLRDRRVVTPPDAVVFDTLVREPLPRSGRPVDEAMAKLFDELIERATLVNHPRFFAYVPGPGSFVGALGEWLAAATNCFVGTWLGGAVMAQLEVQVLEWLTEALGLPPALAGGVLTSGGSMANLGAIAAARARALDDDRFTVFVGAETHYSVRKAARILGIPGDRIVTIPVDAEQRMQVDELERRLGSLDGPSVVCATAGTTSTGAVDPIEAIADLCLDSGAWLHVDGAWGAAFAILPEEVALRRALGRADSIAVDPHKALYCPFESGCLLSREPDSLRAAFAGDAAYMQDVPRDHVNFFERGPELSRGNRALKLWLLLRSVGVDALAEAVRNDARLCRRAHDRLAADPRIEIVTPPRLSVFSFVVEGGDRRNEALVRSIMADGFLMLSSSRLDDRFIVRWCVANHRTDDSDIDASVDRVLTLLGGLE